MCYPLSLTTYHSITMKIKDYGSWDKSRLIEEVKRLSVRKKYGLVWEDKPEDVVERCKTELPVLEEVEERAIESDPSLPTNLIIEGDNYHALSVLSYTHTGKVDVIYIDPPYNTGNKDFIYNDRCVDREDAFRHSKWISLMERRLRLSAGLLSKNGLIFISIDDNEQAHLKLLCNEVFGEENFINQFVWINNLKGRQIQGVGAAGTSEYVLCYGRSGHSISQFQYSASFLKSIMPSAYKGFENEVKEDAAGKYIISNELYNTNSVFNEVTRPNLVFDIWYRESDSDIRFDDPRDKRYTKIEPHKNSDGIHKYHAYRWSKRKILSESRDLEFIKNGKTFKIYTKRRDFDSTIVKDLITDITTNVGGAELKEMGIKGFNYPKPTILIEFLVSISAEKNATILDFFSGSGTTGHAVQRLNAKDGGKRQFILCTNNENGIAEQVTYPRIKSMINGYGKVKGIPSNVRYFKTSFVPKSDVSDDTRQSLIAKSTEMLCIKESTFRKVADNKKFKIYRNQEQSTGVLFDLDAIDEFKQKLDSTKLPTSIYVFSLTSDNFSEDFEDLKIKHSIRPIPEGILEVYRKIFF